MASWRIAESLKQLRKQINEAYPNRSKVSDGSIGDASHSARASDHNPNAAGVVCAIDVTHDPVHGMNGHHLAETLIENRDSRIKYVIWNSRIASKEKGWIWRPYTGANAHKHHVHISVSPIPQLYDSTREWDLDIAKTTVQPKPKPTTAISPSSTTDKKDAAVHTASSQSANKPVKTSVVEEPADGGIKSDVPPVTIPVQPVTVQPEVAVPVVQARAEVSELKDEVAAEAKTQIKSRFIAIPGMILGSLSAFWERFTSGETVLVYWLIAAVVILAVAYIGYSKWQDYHEKQIALEKERKDIDLKIQREIQAHEITLRQMESAMRKDLNTVVVVPQPLANSDAPEGEGEIQ